MQNLPSAAVYLEELKYMPWGTLIKEVQKKALKETKKGGRVLDLMCGPGFLLGELKRRRPDLTCHGVDLEEEYIAHARRSHPNVTFDVAGAFRWLPNGKFDLVLCTAGIHHLPDKEQRPFIRKIASLVASDGYAIIADPYIGKFKTKRERLVKAAQLGYEYFVDTIKNGAPPEIIEAAVQVLHNDVLGVEWKTSAKKMRAMLEASFENVHGVHTWPWTPRTRAMSDWGDYYFEVSNN